MVYESLQKQPTLEKMKNESMQAHLFCLPECEIFTFALQFQNDGFVFTKLLIFLNNSKKIILMTF